MTVLPVLPVIIPLITAAALAALTKLLHRYISSAIAIASALATAACAGLLFAESLREPIVYWFGGWKPNGQITLGISFTIDPLGAGLALFTAILTVAALLFGAQYFDSVENHFHALILCFMGAMCGFSLTGDMFNMFVFFELMSAAAYALCAYKTEDATALQGGLNFAVVNTIGAYFVVSGIGLLYAQTGALNMAQMGDSLASHPIGKLAVVAFTFISCGYLTKAAIVPFHFWLADAHAVAPTPICVLFSGVMVEMGLYGATRVYWAVFSQSFHGHTAFLRLLFVCIGTGTAAVAGVMCYSQRNVKRLLAFSTISHMGVMVSGVGLLTAAGLAGAAVYVIGHGLVKGGLFLAAGILLHRFSTVDEMELHGKGSQTKWTGAAFFLGAVGLAGMPGSGIATGDDLIHDSAKVTGLMWIRWVVFFASAFTSAAVVRIACRIFFGWGPSKEDEPGSAPNQEEQRETDPSVGATPLTMIVPALFLVIAGSFFGFVPQLKQVAVESSANFENAKAYSGHVLAGQPMPQPSVPVPQESHPWLGVIAFATGVVGALADLFSKKFRSIAKLIAVPLRVLHGFHSGHLGDYVAFLTFGITAFGLVCVWFLR